MGIKLIRKQFNTFQIGICGGQLGSSGTLEYFNNIGVDFMVCTLDQLPITKVASAQAYITSSKEPYWADPLEIPYWL